MNGETQSAKSADLPSKGLASGAPAPRICVVIPVYNHALTVRRVVEGARAFFPVIVVNDGSTDHTTAELAVLKDVGLLNLAPNQGKGAALLAGFARAAELGFTHAITLDADGQHDPAALAGFAEACRRQPHAIIVGVRDLKRAGAPGPRRVANHFSNFWFHFQTGCRLGDTQCGYRCYPLGAIRHLRVRAGRYAYELEVLVKAAWAGVPLVGHPVEADYAAPTSRLSHFHPWLDMARYSCTHSRLSMQAFFVPAPLRRMAARGELRQLPPGQRIRTALRHVFLEHTGTPAQVGATVGLGLFCGIAPIWGFQMVAAAALAHRFRLNKALALTASNISFAPLAPFIVMASLILGHWLWTGGWVSFHPETARQQIPLYLWEYVLGSLALAAAVGGAGGFAAWLLARVAGRGKPTPAHD